MERNAIILHGACGNSQGNWFPWLKKGLEKKGYKVWCPDLPNPDRPLTKDWLHCIFSNKDWQLNEKSIIVGHSAGATFILRILEKLPEEKQIDRVILVAGPASLGTNPNFFPYKKSLVEKPFDWEKIKRSARKFYFIHSDNDRYQCGIDQGKIFQKYIGGKLIIKSGEDHFNLETAKKYKKFPLLLQLID